MNEPFILKEISVTVSTDKDVLKIDLFEDENKNSASFLVSTASYKGLVDFFIRTGYTIQADGVNLGFPEKEEDADE